jgi:hypothetical protein
MSLLRYLELASSLLLRAGAERTSLSPTSIRPMPGCRVRKGWGGGRRSGRQGIVTGESLEQVVSQTLDNLFVLNSAASMPIYGLFICFDKVKSEKLARKIGTFQASIAAAEGCKAVPQKPATKGKLDRVLKIEDGLEFLMMQ